ncbi:CVNH domain-containing protein [Sorangium sp. So ce302]|uniref:CVNH domain-containing protein n=1 Tax=Sorangium sp. So ce302 TaxID=3133297 RepID=UPI003F5E6067
MNKHFRHTATLSLGLWVFFLAYSAQAQGDFDWSCRNIAINPARELLASCKTIAGNYQFTALALDECIAHIDGDLYWVHNGNFSWECPHCELDFDGNRPWIECDCPAGGAVRHARLALFQGIINLNGQLQCLP